MMKQTTGLRQIRERRISKFRLAKPLLVGAALGIGVLVVQPKPISAKAIEKSQNVLLVSKQSDVKKEQNRNSTSDDLIMMAITAILSVALSASKPVRKISNYVVDCAVKASMFVK